MGHLTKQKQLVLCGIIGLLRVRVCEKRAARTVNGRGGPC